MWWWGEQEAPEPRGGCRHGQGHKQRSNITIKTVLQTTDGLIPSFEAAAAANEAPTSSTSGAASTPSSRTGPTRSPRCRTTSRPGSSRTTRTPSLEDTYDGKTLTAPWYVNPQFPVLVRNDVLDEHGLEVPETWDDLLDVCDTLSAAGVTTLAGGVKDGWFGGWPTPCSAHSRWCPRTT